MLVAPTIPPDGRYGEGDGRRRSRVVCADLSPVAEPQTQSQQQPVQSLLPLVLFAGDAAVVHEASTATGSQQKFTCGCCPLSTKARKMQRIDLFLPTLLLRVGCDRVGLGSEWGLDWLELWSDRRCRLVKGKIGILGMAALLRPLRCWGYAKRICWQAIDDCLYTTGRCAKSQKKGYIQGTTSQRRLEEAKQTGLVQRSNVPVLRRTQHQIGPKGKF